MYGRRHLPHSCHRQRVAQACSRGLQRDDGFLECGPRFGIQEVGIPSIGTGPDIVMLACREMATPVRGMGRKRDGDLPRRARLRLQHPLPAQGASIKRALIVTRIGVGPLRQGREGGLHLFQRVLPVMVCQEHMSMFLAVTLPKATTSRSASRRTPGGPGRSGCSGLAADPQRVAPAAAGPAAPLGPWRLSAAPVSAGHGTRRRQRDQCTSVAQNPPARWHELSLFYQG